LAFTRAWLADGGAELPVSRSRRANHRRGVWQRRFWEHLIRDEADYLRHVEYIHYNPVKHGLAACPHAWAYSTFSQWCADGHYELDWGCACEGRPAWPPDFSALEQTAME
jgi:putative transposase